MMTKDPLTHDYMAIATGASIGTEEIEKIEQNNTILQE